MPILYTAASRDHISYVLDPGGEDSCKLICNNQIEAEYRAIQYGLTEYFNKWQKELDARAYDGEQKTSSPAVFTNRQLPDAVEIRTCLPIRDESRLKYQLIAKNIAQMLRNVEHKFTYIDKNENIARRLLK